MVRLTNAVVTACLFTICALFAASATFVQAEEVTYAWVSRDGTVKATSLYYPLNVTRIKPGHYCFNKPNATVLCYYCMASVTATLQTGGGARPNVGFVSVNTGWGDECNPEGGTAVRTFDRDGKPADMDFSMIVVKH